MKRFSALIFLLLILCTTAMMLLYPQAAYQGACQGLETWSVHLVPSLLPFFIVADLLLSMGFVRFLGVLLEPIMRPLFRLPGEAGFAVALGFTSGFPMGAILTASLKEQQLCTAQGSRSAGGVYQQFQPIVSAHCCAGIHAPLSPAGRFAAAGPLSGQFYRRHFAAVYCAPRHPSDSAVRLIAHCRWANAAISGAAQAIHRRHAGAGSAKRHPQHCQYRRLCADVLRIITAAAGQSITTAFAAKLCLFITHIAAGHPVSAALSAGLFEMTLGAQTAAESRAPLLQQLMIISFILGWSGLSIQAQVSSILSGQKISSRLYCLCRPLQGLLAAAYIPLLTVLFPQILSVDVFWSTEPMPAAIPYLSLYLCPLAALLLLLLLAAISRLYDIYRARTHLS